MPFSHVEYKNIIPEGLIEKLDGLYQSIYCTKDYLQTFELLHDFNTFCIYKKNELVHIIIYKKTFFGITILNELFDIESSYLDYFSRHIFKNLKRCKVIHINRLTSQPQSGLPQKIWDIKNNVAIDLPNSFDEFREKISKKTRTNYQYSKNKLKRDHGEYNFQFDVGKDIEQKKIDLIFSFNKARMDAKKISSCFDKEFEAKISHLCRKYGTVGSLNLKEKTIAGSISYKVGSHVYGYIISHNPEFNKYSPGILCNIFMIEELIERGIKKFHMEYGESIYKYKILGQKNEVYYFSLYKNNFYKLFGNLIFYKKHRIYKKILGFLKYQIIGKFFNFK